MQKKRTRWAASLVAIVGFTCVGLTCATVADDGVGSDVAVADAILEDDRTATIFAAVSLVDVLGELAEAFEEATGRDITLVTGASSTLSRQILAGAPADGFISAARVYADIVAEKDDLDVYDLFGNRLSLIAPVGFEQEINLKHLLDELEGGRLAVGDPAHVPAGIYAQQVLTALGLWDEAGALLASANDVRGAVNFVATGAAPLGIVYRTDAQDPRVQEVLVFDEAWHDPIRYWGVEVNAQSLTAELFFTFINSFDGQNLLDYYGFNSVTSLE